MTTIHAAPAFPPAIPGPLVALWNDGIALGGAPYVAFTKGAVDRLLDMSDAVWVNRRAEPLDAAWRARMVAAVEEGRVIYDNIRKFIKYRLTSNAGELWPMLLAPLLGMPLP